MKTTNPIESIIMNLLVAVVLSSVGLLGVSRPEPLIGAIIIGIIVLFSNVTLTLYIMRIKSNKGVHNNPLESVIRNFLVMGALLSVNLYGVSQPEPLIGAIIIGIIVLFSNVTLTLYIMRIKKENIIPEANPIK